MRSGAGRDGVRGPSQGRPLALGDVTEGPVQDGVPGPGEPVVFVAFGPVLMAGAACAQAGEVPLPVILLSIPVGMVTASVLLGNNLRDAGGGLVI